MEGARYDAMFEEHRIARKHGATVETEVEEVTTDYQPLTVAQLRARQARIRQARFKVVDFILRQCTAFLSLLSPHTTSAI